MKERLGMSKLDLVFCLTTIFIMNVFGVWLFWKATGSLKAAVIVGIFMFLIMTPLGLITYPTKRNNYGRGLY